MISIGIVKVFMIYIDAQLCVCQCSLLCASVSPSQTSARCVSADDAIYKDIAILNEDYISLKDIL
jgi:hypothetical protein